MDEHSQVVLEVVFKLKKIYFFCCWSLGFFETRKLNGATLIWKKRVDNKTFLNWSFHFVQTALWFQIGTNINIHFSRSLTTFINFVFHVEICCSIFLFLCASEISPVYLIKTFNAWETETLGPEKRFEILKVEAECSYGRFLQRCPSVTDFDQTPFLSSDQEVLISPSQNYGLIQGLWQWGIFLQLMDCSVNIPDS